MKPIFLILVFQFLSIFAFSQYAPGVGMPGTTAIHMDSAIFIGWATNATVNPSWVNISDTTSGKVNLGTSVSALGKADNDVVSLGDGGFAVLSFAHPIINGPGWDFAIFENSFDGQYLELAFVEVSSDGVNFARFPAHSLSSTQSQIQAFGTLDPTKINNLAGKYKAGYGTPFDLEELSFLSSVNVNAITHIRIIDVVGSIDTNYASFDTAGNIINDPWPTIFPSSGFDLDAVGVIHSALSIGDNSKEIKISLYPNPATEIVNLVTSSENRIINIEIADFQGRIIFSENYSSSLAQINVCNLESGIYILKCQLEFGEIIMRRIIVQH